MSGLTCPYCDEDLDDPDEAYSEDEVYQGRCRHCDHSFVFTICYSVNYYSEKAACLNGEPHNYEPCIGYPEEYFKRRRRCSICSKEITVKEEPKP